MKSARLFISQEIAMKKVIKILFEIIAVLLLLTAGLFTIYIFNLDMKLTVNVIAPFLDRIYDKRERKQSV